MYHKSVYNTKLYIDFIFREGGIVNNLARDPSLKGRPTLHMKPMHNAMNFNVSFLFTHITLTHTVMTTTKTTTTKKTEKRMMMKNRIESMQTVCDLPKLILAYLKTF